jgi:hypothetical protein
MSILLSKKSKVICQGITGASGSLHTRLCKEYGTNIIVAESTKSAVGDAYEFRVLDDVKVKGKEQAVRIYELIGKRAEASGGGDPPRTGTRTGTTGATMTALIAAVALSLAVPASLGAQAAPKERWVDYVYVPGKWQGGRVVADRTPNNATDTLAVTARVDTYVRAPRWRDCVPPCSTYNVALAR